MNWRNFSAILFGLLLIAIGIIIWMFQANESNQQSAALDRNVLIKAAEEQKVKDDSIITAERHARAQEQAQHERDRLAYRNGRETNRVELRALNQARDIAGIKVDPFTVKIEKKYHEQRVKDSLEIVRLEKKIFSDSSSFERQISAETDKYLQQVVISDQHLEEVQELKTYLKKERTQKNLWKWGAIVLGVGLVYESVKD